MPNGDSDTVQVQMPDGRVLTGPRKNLPIAMRMGGKLYKPSPEKPESDLKAFGRGAALGAFSGLGIPETQHPLADLWKNITKPPDKESIIRHLIDPTGGAFTASLDIGKNLFGAVKEGVTAKTPEEAGHGLGSTLTQAATLGTMTEAPEIAGGKSEVVGAAKAVSNVPKSAAREFMGVADKDVQPLIDKSKADVAKAEADHTAKVEAIKDKTADQIAKVQQSKIEASKSKSASETRQSALVTKRGPVFQRMTEIADKAQANVQDVDKKVRALEGAKWNALKRTVGNTPVDWQPVQQAVVDAEENILQGSPESIAIFRNIMKEGEGQGGLADASVFRGRQGVDVKEFLSSIHDPIKRDQFIAEMRAQGQDVSASKTGIPKEGATVPFDTARGFYTEFGQKIAGRELPGDVRRALRSVQDAVDAQTTKAIAKAGGKDAVLEYHSLKSAWRDYMQTFYDRDSPIRKLKEGKDPNDKLTPITGDEGERAISLLGKYRNLGTDVQSLGRLRSLHKSIKELSPSKAKVPADVEKLTLPENPSAKELTEQQARRAKLDAAAKTYSHPPSRWELMFPPLHAYRLALKNLLQSESFKEWLSKGGGAVPSGTSSQP